MAISPYLPVFLSDHGGGLLLALVWGILGIRSRDAVLSIAAVVLTCAISTHMVPLLTSRPLPLHPTALGVAAVVPFVAVALRIARERGGGRADLDPIRLLPLALVPGGWPAWVLGITLVGRGRLAPGTRRGGTAMAVVALVLAGGIDADRMAARDFVGRCLDVSTDVQGIVAHSVVTALEVVGFVGLSWPRPDAPDRAP